MKGKLLSSALMVGLALVLGSCSYVNHEDEASASASHVAAAGVDEFEHNFSADYDTETFMTQQNDDPEAATCAAASENNEFEYICDMTCDAEALECDQVFLDDERVIFNLEWAISNEIDINDELLVHGSGS